VDGSGEAARASERVFTWALLALHKRLVYREVISLPDVLRRADSFARVKH